MINLGVIDGVLVSPQTVVDVPGGDIYHAMKSSAPGYNGFGEAYFSTIESNVIKAWKRHREMTLNLLVPCGAIRFIIFDDRANSISAGIFQVVTLSLQNYCRLTVPPGLWMGFQGVSVETSLLLNIANIEHDVEEVDRIEVNKIKFEWEAIL